MNAPSGRLAHMHSGLTTDILRQAISNMARKMESCADELNALDNQIGDGDIGVTMVTGFRAMLEVSAKLPDDVGMALMMCAQAFTGTRASSFGTLFATGIMAFSGSLVWAWKKVQEIMTS